MTMQLLGMGMIVLATTLLGIHLGARVGYRISDLQSIRRAITLLRSEITYRLTPLPTACHHIGTKAQGAVGQIFSRCHQLLTEEQLSFQEAFDRAIQAYQGKMYLQEEDLRELSALGKSLGHIDKEMQSQQMDLMLAYIDHKIMEQQPIYLKNKKMYQTLGVLSGLLIVVILI